MSLCIHMNECLTHVIITTTTYTFIKFQPLNTYCIYIYIDVCAIYMCRYVMYVHYMHDFIIHQSPTCRYFRHIKQHEFSQICSKTYICTYICMICIYRYTYTYIKICTYIHIRMCISIYTYIHIYICVCI